MKGRLALLCLSLALGVVSLAQGQGRQVTLLGLVVDSVTNQPLDKVAVYLPDDASTDTKSDGMFKLKFIPGESSLILFRKIGYAPRAIRMNLEGREGRDIDVGKVILKRLAVTLDPVAIETRMLSRNPRMVDFY